MSDHSVRPTRRDILKAATAGMGTLGLTISGCTRKTQRDLSVLYFSGLAEGERLNRKGDEFTAKTNIKVHFLPEKYDNIRVQQKASFDKSEADYDVIFVDD